jgi:type IV pilus biogenesis protein CpaD/CtpE
MSLRLVRTILAVVMVSLLCGCTRKPPPPPAPVPVKGKILNQNKEPLALALVSFWPQQREDPHTPDRYDGGTEKDGTFTLKCPPGDYMVTVTRLPTNATAGGLTAGPGSSLIKGIDPKYAEAKATPWNVTVPEGGKEDVLLTVK